jgi:hypothetical protein
MLHPKKSLSFQVLNSLVVDNIGCIQIPSKGKSFTNLPDYPSDKQLFQLQASLYRAMRVLI